LFSLLSPLPALTEELESVASELHAIDIQIQELTERRQELLQRKSVLTGKIKQYLEDSSAEASSDLDTSPAAWNKEGLPLSCLAIVVIKNEITLWISVYREIKLAWGTCRQIFFIHVL
jgi:chromosome segregation ATPase